MLPYYVFIRSAVKVQACKELLILELIPSFPEEISDQDFSYLQSPVLWVKGKRAIISLHRLAHASNISYFASAPIGETNAFIGLVVASGENSHLPPIFYPN